MSGAKCVLAMCLLMVLSSCDATNATPTSTDTPDVPEGSTPLTKTEIEQLLEGRTYEFVAYDEPLIGTTNWDFERGTVSGTYTWKGSEKGEFDNEVFIDEQNRLCIVQTKGTVCQIVYRYENGFMEVTPGGIVHAVSRPAN